MSTKDVFFIGIMLLSSFLLSCNWFSINPCEFTHHYVKLPAYTLTMPDTIKVNDSIVLRLEASDTLITDENDVLITKDLLFTGILTVGNLENYAEAGFISNHDSTVICKSAIGGLEYFDPSISETDNAYFLYFNEANHKYENETTCIFTQPGIYFIKVGSGVNDVSLVGNTYENECRSELTCYYEMNAGADNNIYLLNTVPDEYWRNWFKSNFSRFGGYCVVVK
ncbi:MAG: hypothetical protein R2798_06670 [Chitinophagales bacterium]|nr:hypothetical protein [Bacteroidota bacterium]MCB9043685.1 hypothetical protein [Chitinophagales bacterium]